MDAGSAPPLIDLRNGPIFFPFAEPYGLRERRNWLRRPRNVEQVRLWARTTSDYSKAFTRIRDTVAALPVESAVLNEEAIVLRLDNTSDFEALRSRQGQAEAVLVADDIWR